MGASLGCSSSHALTCHAESCQNPASLPLSPLPASLKRKVKTLGEKKGLEPSQIQIGVEGARLPDNSVAGEGSARRPGLCPDPSTWRLKTPGRVPSCPASCLLSLGESRAAGTSCARRRPLRWAGRRPFPRGGGFCAPRARPRARARRSRCAPFFLLTETATFFCRWDETRPTLLGGEAQPPVPREARAPANLPLPCLAGRAPHN